MIQRLQISCLVFFIHLFSYSQGIKVAAFIYEEATGAPIPFATITAAKEKIITDASESGYFEFFLEKDDTLTISSIGFIAVKIYSASLKGNDSIFLARKENILPEVMIGNTKSYKLGIDKSRKKFDMHYVNGGRYELATAIEIPDSIKRYQIKKLFIRGFGFNAENPVRIHIYSVGIYGQPAEDLLKQDIIIKDAIVKRGILELDVDDQDLFLDERSFFVSVQWIADRLNSKFINSKSTRLKGPGIYCTESLPKPLTYKRIEKILNYDWCIEGGVTKDDRIEWGLTKGDRIAFPYYNKPDKIESPLNMLVSAQIIAF